VVEGVVPNEMASFRDARRRFGECLHPAALQEEGCADPVPVEQLEEALLDTRCRRSIRVLGIERQGDPEAVYFSTPVITIPRTKKRWKIRNRRIGIASVIRVPAWMRPGSDATRAPLKRASPTATVCRSGVEDR
jgi:hypothetical protein